MIDRILRVGLMSAIFLSPFSLSFGLVNSVGNGPTIRLPPTEPILWFLLVLWLIQRHRHSQSKSPALLLPPLPFAVFILMIGLSAIMTSSSYFGSPADWLRSLKEVIQAVDAYFIFLLLLLNIFRRQNDSQILFRVICGLTVTVVVVGVLQLLFYTQTPFLVSSIFPNRNVLSSFLAVILPLLYGVLIFEKRKDHRIFLGGIILSGILICSSVAALTISLAVMAVLSRWLLRRHRKFYTIAVTATAGITIFLVGHSNTLLHIFHEPSSSKVYHTTIRKSAGMLVTHSPLEFDISQEHRVQILTSAWPPAPDSAYYRSAVENLYQARRRDQIHSQGVAHIKQRFLEWQAALHVLAKFPLLGVGPGRYQEVIGYHYYSLPKLNTLEPDTQNGFLVLAATTGFIGLSAFICMLLHLIKMLRVSSSSLNRSSTGRGSSDFECGLDLGLAGAFISFIIANCYYDISSRHSTTLLFVMICSMILLRHRQRQNDPASVEASADIAIPLAAQRSSVFVRICNIFAELTIYLILALPLIFWQSTSFKVSLVFFLSAGVIFLAAVRPHLRHLMLVLLVALAAGLIFFTTRFIAHFPLTASPSYIVNSFLGQFLRPLQTIWIVAIVSGILYAICRRYISEIKSTLFLEPGLLLVTSLIIYQNSLSLRFNIPQILIATTIPEIVRSIPYATVLLLLAITLRLVGSFRLCIPALLKTPTVQSQVAALALVFGHVVILFLLLSLRYESQIDTGFTLLGALSGISLFSVLVKFQTHAVAPGHRYSFVIGAVLIMTIILIWSGIRMLTDHTPGVYVAYFDGKMQ